MIDPEQVLLGFAVVVAFCILMGNGFKGAEEAETKKPIPMEQRTMLNSNILSLGAGGCIGWGAGIFLVTVIVTVVLLALAH